MEGGGRAERTSSQSHEAWNAGFTQIACFRCQACKEADAKNATLAFGSQTHFWKAVSVSRCASKRLLEHVIGMKVMLRPAHINSLEGWKGLTTIPPSP